MVSLKREEFTISRFCWKTILPRFSGIQYCQKDYRQSGHLETRFFKARSLFFVEIAEKSLF